MDNYASIIGAAKAALKTAENALRLAREPHSQGVSYAMAVAQAAITANETTLARREQSRRALESARQTLSSIQQMNEETRSAASVVVQAAERELEAASLALSITRGALAAAEQGLTARKAPYADAEKTVESLVRLVTLLEAAQQEDLRAERDRPSSREIIDEYLRQSDPLKWDRDHDPTR